MMGKEFNPSNAGAATLQDIVDQLEFCEYKTGDGYHPLANNVAFIELKRRAAEEPKHKHTSELVSYMAPDGWSGNEGVHVYEICIQSGGYRAALYEAIGGNVKGAGILETALSITDFEKRPGIWEKNLTLEQIAANNRYGIYESDEDCDENCPYHKAGLGSEGFCLEGCGGLTEVRLFNAADDVLTISVEEIEDYVVGVRIISWTRKSTTD